MDYEKEIMNLWFDLIRTQELLQQSLDKNPIELNNDKAREKAFRKVKDMFPEYAIKWK